MINPEWTPKIEQAITVHFVDELPSVYIYKDGGVDNRQNTWVELFIDGPDYYKRSQTEYLTSLYLELMIVSPPDLKAFSHAELVGLVESKIGCIQVPGLGYLTVEDNGFSDIEKIPLGLDTQLNQLRTSVRAYYEMSIKE